MKKRWFKVLLLCTFLALLTMGVSDCNKQDVITTLKVTQNTLNVLYNGTVKPLVVEYCSAQTEEDENYDICQEFTDVIDPAMAEFLETTFPSLIRIADLIIPEGTQLSEDAVGDAFMEIYSELSPEQQARVKQQILSE